MRIAECRAREQDVDGAWTALKAADRQLLWTYSEAELDAERVRVRKEAKAKLTGWRRKFILATLAPATEATKDPGKSTCQDDPQRGSGVPPSGPIPAIEDGSRQGGTDHHSTDQPDCAPSDAVLRVLEARRVLDDAFDNKYRKIALLRESLRQVALSLLASLILVLAFGIAADLAGIDALETASPLSHWTTFLLIAALGAVGANLSALLSVKDQQLAARIPETVRSNTSLWLRPLIGATSALVIVLFLQSEIAGISADPKGLLIAAVAAGFAERAATHALLSTANKVLPKSSAKTEASKE